MSNRKAASLVFCTFFLALLCSAGTARSSASPGTLQLSASNYNAAPGTAAVFIKVERTGGSSGSAVAQYGTFDGTAVAGTDYTATSGTLIWSDGDANPKSFMVLVAANAAGPKNFNISLITASGAAFGTPINAVWSRLAPLINAHPLTSTAYPTSYPRP